MSIPRRFWLPEVNVTSNAFYPPDPRSMYVDDWSFKRKRFANETTTRGYKSSREFFPLGNMRRGGGGGGGGGYNHNMHNHPPHHTRGGGGDRGSGSRNRAFAQNSQQPVQMGPYVPGSRPNPFPLPQQHYQPLPVQASVSQPPANNYTPVTVSDMPPVETVVARLETACRLLHGIGGNNTRINEISHEIQILSEDLRRVGPHLETTYPDVLDRVMSSMRDASSMPSLPPSLRLAIFELVELRASKWMLPSDSSNYYRQRRNLNDPGDISEEGSANTGHYPRASGTISKPEPMYNTISSPKTSPLPPNPINVGVANKTYREEILIKNSDSGKVAPTAKERVLSINGYSQQSINMAKQLIQETITRNASPVFDGLPIGDYNAEGDSDVEAVASAMKKMHMNMHTGKSEDEDSHFNYTVTLGAEDVIKISGKNLQYVQKHSKDIPHALKLTKMVIYGRNFSEIPISMGEDEVEMVQLVPRYDRATLLSLSVVETAAPDFSHLDPEVRSTIVLQERRKFDVQQLISRNSTKEDANPVEIVPG